MSNLPAGPWLNVGCGVDCPAGWVNIDGSWQAWLASHSVVARLASRLAGRQVGHWPRSIVRRDIRRGLGYDSATVAVVFSSHFIEHLYRDEALAFLQEARRVLKAGGVCRIVVPDVAAVVGWYLDHRAAGSDGRPSSELLMEMLSLRPNSAPSRWGLLAWYRRWTNFESHKWMYDVEGLANLFLQAGFSGPRHCGHLDSDIPERALAAVEHADRIDNGAGVCVEARR